MLTRSGYMKILGEIMETGGLTDNMENQLERLRDDFDEREGVLKRFGETYDGEDKEDYEYKPRERENDGAGDWEQKYNDLKERYKQRFFNGASQHVDEQVIDDTEEKQEREYDEPETYEELLKKEED